MKHHLTFCQIHQLSDNVFEIIPEGGIVIDKNCAEECWNFWNELRYKPFGLLVNCENNYSLSFEGSREIGSHSLQHKTAILVTNENQMIQMETVVEIKKLMGVPFIHQFFIDRDEAIKWLSDI